MSDISEKDFLKFLEDFFNLKEGMHIRTFNKPQEYYEGYYEAMTQFSKLIYNHFKKIV